MNNKFTTKIGFILTAVGSAVGMANIWGFPYKFQDGGLIFLIFYILFVILFAFVGLTAEFAVGRLAKSGALGAYEYAYKTNNKNKTLAKYIGFIPLAGVFMISIGYSVILAYVARAFVEAITGSLLTVDPTAWFDSFSLKPYSVVPYHIIIIVLTILTCIGGAKTIEKSNKIMMPAFFVLFLILALRILTLPEAIEGYKYMFRFDIEKLNLNTIVMAMGQAFFSLSIAGAGMVMVGSYTEKDVDLLDSSKKTGLFDFIAALIASCVMIPALTVFDMKQVGGPGLLFVSLPTIMQNIKFGRIFSILLYLAVVLAGISSLQNMYEAVAESLISRFKGLSRNIVLLAIGLLSFVLSVNMETIDRFGPYMDMVSIYIIPIGASIGAITWFYILKKDQLIDEVNVSASQRVGDKWYKIGKYLYVPLAVVLTLLALIFKISF